MIPKQLKKEEFRFTLLKRKEKKPFEFNWTSNNYKHNDEKLLSWIKEGNNYGVIGGFGGLLVLDFDEQWIQDKIVPLLPKTFTVKTGSGKLHKYFICDDASSFKVLDNVKNTLMDVQGEGKQVVGAGSIHPNGDAYEVIDKSEIAHITIKRLKILLNDYLKEKDRFKPEHFGDPVISKIREKVSLRNLMDEYGYDTTKNPTMCRLGHDSKGGHCFSFNENAGLWNCFHCDEGGDIFNFIMQHEKCNFSIAKRKLLVKAGIKNNIAAAVRQLDQDYVDFAQKFYDIQPYFYDKAKIWWLWDYEKCKWEMVDKTDILNAIYESAKEAGIRITESSIKSNILTALEMIGRINTPKPVPKRWVQFKNRIYDIESGAIYESTPEYFNVNPIPWELGTSKDTPVMDKIFKEWVGEPYFELLYDIISYSVLQDFPLHRIFVLVGSGCNGKSVFLNLLSKFVGDDNFSSTELDSLMERFGSSVLYKKLLCVIGETNSNQLEKTGILKKISGNDTIDFEFKGKDRFKGKSYCELIIATNTLPTTIDRTDGFYRRFVILEFPNKFSEKVDILSTIPDEEFNNLALKSLYNLKRLLEERKFRHEGTLEERKARYERFSNPLSEFIKLYCKRDVDGEVPAFELFEEYGSYLKKNGHRKVSKREFNNLMKEEGFGYEKICKKMCDEWKSWWYFTGVSFQSCHSFQESELKSLYREQTEKQGMNGMFGMNQDIVGNQVTKPLDIVFDTIQSSQHIVSFDTIHKKTSIDEQKLEKNLKELKEKGKIFEPKIGFFKAL